MSEEQAEIYTRQMLARPVRQKVEEAWKRKDYPTVQRLYGSLEDDLTAVEAKNLKYARKHSGLLLRLSKRIRRLLKLN